MAIHKPVTILREDFINDLVSLIKNSGLPFFILEPILRDAHTDIAKLAQKQLEKDKQDYESQLNSSNSTEEML